MYGGISATSNAVMGVSSIYSGDNLFRDVVGGFMDTPLDIAM